MGKALIIKGADFSANRVGRIEVWESLEIVDKTTIITSGNIGDLGSSDYKCASKNLILLKDGETISVRGLSTAKCADSGLSEIEVRFVLYNQNEYSAESYDSIGLNKKIAANSDEVSYINDKGKDVYVGFTYGLPWSSSGTPSWSFADATLEYFIQ